MEEVSDLSADVAAQSPAAFLRNLLSLRLLSRVGCGTLDGGDVVTCIWIWLQ